MKLNLQDNMLMAPLLAPSFLFMDVRFTQQKKQETGDLQQFFCSHNSQQPAQGDAPASLAGRKGKTAKFVICKRMLPDPQGGSQA